MLLRFHRMRTHDMKHEQANYAGLALPGAGVGREPDSGIRVHLLQEWKT